MIPGEHAQRRSVARLHHRSAELDCGVEEMSLSAGAKLRPEEILVRNLGKQVP